MLDVFIKFKKGFDRGMEFQWGDKGCAYRPDKCKHPKESGCEWCCMTCNTDTHRCPNCGTVSNHEEEPCGLTPEDCYKPLRLNDPDGMFPL